MNRKLWKKALSALTAALMAVSAVPHESETDFIVPLGYKFVKDHLKKLAKANGFNLSFHDLRYLNAAAGRATVF